MTRTALKAEDETHYARSALPIGPRVCKRGIGPYNVLIKVARRACFSSFQEADECSLGEEEQK